MNKVILMSIQPKRLVEILNGEKTIEIRKTMPKCKLPIDVYLYCTKGNVSIVDIWDEEYRGENPRYVLEIGKSPFPERFNIINGKVVAKFTLNKVEDCCDMSLPELEDKSLLNINEICSYIKAKEVDPKMVYAWHIDNLVIFDKPKELSEFEKEEYYSTPNGWFPSFQSLTKAPQSWRYAYVMEELK